MIEDDEVPEVVELSRFPASRGPAKLSDDVARIDILRVCAHHAEQEGTTLDAVLWVMMKGLIARGSVGDAKCAELALRFLAVQPEDRRTVDVNVNAGPPLPDATAFARNLAEVARIAGDMELARVSEPDEFEDLLTELTR